jgi:TRAP-type transport system periplasmic protein
MFRKIAAALSVALFVVLGHATLAHAKTTLKIATLAPPQSPWGKVFKTWSRAVDARTKGQVDIVWLWNGTAGPERAVVGKIRSGQISGGAITAVGLADIHKPILALQMPGAFSSWAQLDAARNKLKPQFEAAMRAKGFYLAGFGDVGIGRIMSHGFAVNSPSDLRGHHPGVVADDIIGPKVYEVIGGVSPVPSNVTTFLPKLSSGAIDVMDTPALAAEQLQWASRLDHINTAKTYFSIGALVLSQSQLDQLPADQREVVTSTGKLASAALTARIRAADDAAFVRLKSRMVAHDPTPAETAAWKSVFKQACERLKGALPGNVLREIGAC